MIRYTVLSAMILISISAFSQKFMISTYAEITKVSPKNGFSFSYNTRDSIEFGAFFQESYLLERIVNSSDEKLSQLPRFYERQFYGLFMSYPVYAKNLIDLKINIRMGLVNNQSFILTPSFLAGFKLLKKLELGAGLGIRSFRPTVRGSIKVRL